MFQHNRIKFYKRSIYTVVTIRKRYDDFDKWNQILLGMKSNKPILIDTQSTFVTNEKSQG